MHTRDGSDLNKGESSRGGRSQFLNLFWRLDVGCDNKEKGPRIGSAFFA